MPQLHSYTPPWLSPPSPGAALFSSSHTKGAGSSINTQRKLRYTGPRRTLASRGNELFIVVDNQIRWASLSKLKDGWKPIDKGRNSLPGGESGGRADSSSGQGRYKVLTVPVYEQIRQILSSPNGNFLAVVTDHTIHITVLPDSSHLSSTDSTPIRAKTYQLGPTTHVIPESPVVSALWHPLGLNSNTGGCLVTVTADAAVRIWELDRNNHWSFDRPALAIDLKKLVDGTSLDQDFTPSGLGKSKGFSADTFDMEVASACFGGSGAEGENAWAPMTLWIAMRPGDLYALCPLLPSKWWAPSATVPSLSATVVSELAVLESSQAEHEELTACRQRYDWLKDIDNQELSHAPGNSHPTPGSEIFMRPARPSAVPRLQGPFYFDTGSEMMDLDLCDIMVIAAKADTDDLMRGEDEELDTSGEGDLSATVICLSDRNGRVYICLELNGVEGQWLPKGKSDVFMRPVSNPSDLVLIESLDTISEAQQQPNTWPAFTKDVLSRYSFFLTASANVMFFSLASWTQRLESELQSEDMRGSALRLCVLCEDSVSQREQVLEVDRSDIALAGLPDHLTSCLAYYDYDIGYLLLTQYASNPYAALMDNPNDAYLPILKETDTIVQGSVMHMLSPKRQPYQVPPIFYSNNPLDSFVDKNVPHRHRNTLCEQVRLSPATLDLVTAAHRIVSVHTNALERAASDLFRRCERLQNEMYDQLKQMSDISERVKDVLGEIGEDGRRTERSRGEALDKRLQDARDRQSQLVQRYESLQSTLLKSGGRPLSEKEGSWISEVQNLSDSFRDIKDGDDAEAQSFARRLKLAKELAIELVSEAERAASVSTPMRTASPVQAPRGEPKVSQKLQRAKIAEAMKMIERESAIIESITSRLERLNTNV